MSPVAVPVLIYQEAPAEEACQREELVRRVVFSKTLEKSPRSRAFFLHVCRCAMENRPDGATEQQIGVQVFSRPPDYDRDKDSIVRAQARQLRLKLEHYFAAEGEDEPLVITIPKGKYLPVFQTRPTMGVPLCTPLQAKRNRYLLPLLLGMAVLLSLVIWLSYVVVV